MSVKNQSEFDSNGGVVIYPSAEEAPKESSPFLYLLEEDEKDDE